MVWVGLSFVGKHPKILSSSLLERTLNECSATGSAAPVAVDGTTTMPQEPECHGSGFQGGSRSVSFPYKCNLGG